MTKLVLILTCLLLAATTFLAPSTLASAQDEQDPAETELAKEMLEVKDAMRRLRRSIRKPDQRADSLASVRICQAALLKAKAMAPAMAESLPEADRAAFVRDYQIDMVRALEAFLALELALLEERDDEARELYKKAAGTEDPAHERFTEGD